MTPGTPSHESPAILVVDDEPDACENLRDILMDCGYRVDTATSGEAALRHLDGCHYDVALIDLRMPGMNGIELQQQIRQRERSTVCIILSAFASREAAQAASEAGAWRVLSKPIQFTELARTIDQALGAV